MTNTKQLSHNEKLRCVFELAKKHKLISADKDYDKGLNSLLLGGMAWFYPERYAKIINLWNKKNPNNRID